MGLNHLCNALYRASRHEIWHSLVCSLQDLRIRSRWFNSLLGQYSIIVIATGIHSSLTAVHCFDDGCVEKQPVAWKDKDNAQFKTY